MTTVTLSNQVIVGGVILLVTFVALVIISVMNIRSARYASERRFLMWSTAGFWSFLLFLLTVMYFVQPPWRYIVLAIYFVHIPLMIYRVSIRRQLIREYESRQTGNGDSSDPDGT